MKSFKQFLTEKYNINTVNIKCMPGFFDYMQALSKKNKYAKMIIDDSIHSQRFDPNKYYDLCEDLLNTSNYHTKLGNNKDAQNYYNEYQSCREVLEYIDDLVKYEQTYKYTIHLDDGLLKKQYTFKSSKNIQEPKPTGTINWIYPDSEWLKNFAKAHKNNVIAPQIIKQKRSMWDNIYLKYYLKCYSEMVNNPYFKKYVSKNEQKEIENVITSYKDLIYVLDSKETEK